MMARPMGSLHFQKDYRSKKREVFEDILEERRQSSDLHYAMKCYTPVLYKNLTPCKPSAIKAAVLTSDQLQYVMKQISLESGDPLEVIQEQAAEILDEMGHNLHMGAIRLFALSLCKIFKKLFRKVCVNEEGIQRLTQVIQEHPVVLLPSHRSYIDFLMMSYILYTYDLALPVIAAGMDFMSMRIVGELLRMSGAFFMRRTFRGNKLYWAVFAEYVKTILRNGYAPVEFFVEGQRSRPCKTLNPKFGLLNVVMEPFFKGEVYDTYLVPISISYERILEESLYAYELLGVPKPKESTSGLIKARRILNDNFGSIHVHFGQPMSLRSLASGRIHRSQYNLIPRHLPHRPSEEMQSFVCDVAHEVELHQISNMVLSPGVLIAAILLQNLPAINYSVLVDQTLSVKDLTESFGGSLDWPDSMPSCRVVQSSIELHSNFINTVDGQVTLLEYEQTGDPNKELIFKSAVSVLMCASYRNQMVNLYVRPALVVLACKISQSLKKDEIFKLFQFLRSVFTKEFIFFPGFEEKDFEEGCFLLTKCGILHLTSHEIIMNEKGASAALFLSRMFQPFLESYQLACIYLAMDVCETFTEKQYVSGLRNFIAHRILAGVTKCYEALSSDIQKNTLASFVQMGTVKKVKSYPVNKDSHPFFHPHLGFLENGKTRVFFIYQEDCKYQISHLCKFLKYRYTDKNIPTPPIGFLENGKIHVFLFSKTNLNTNFQAFNIFCF
uniref:Glyceronephosphate O-acyltransferase n=1 Tax=Leptobrachium leishanense TaxID=445787 RepID=A0A8C5M7Q7_9ANUR